MRDEAEQAQGERDSGPAGKGSEYTRDLGCYFKSKESQPRDSQVGILSWEAELTLGSLMAPG